MRRTYILTALRGCTLLILAATLVACGDDSPREIVISRPLGGGSNVAVNSPTAAVPTLLPTNTLMPRPTPSPTLSPKVAEYEATVKYWQVSYELLSDILIKYNGYAQVVIAYSSFDDYKAHKAEIIPLADQFNAAVDANLAKIEALNPPPPALAYHSAMINYWRAERSHVSDLRQAIDHDDIDLWNEGSKAERQEQLDKLNAAYRQEQAKLVTNYINKGVAK